MSKTDDVFIREFLATLGALVLFAVVAFFVARTIHANAMDKALSSPALIAERIKPVGQVRTSETGSPPAGTAATAK